jgi:ribonuclease PH
MRKDRAPNQLRSLLLTLGANRHAEGSALLEWGHTRVQATVTLESRLPPHLRGHSKGGWLTAEYALLPRSTQQRVQRERTRASGRTQEIQRLISRSLRSVMRLELFPNQTIIVDVDVLQADGGTRCAGIVAAYAALHDMANRLVYSGKLAEWPLTHELAAVSVGLVAGEEYLDLDFAEDQHCSADLNIIATGDGQILEVQGGSEQGPLPAECFVSLVATGVTAAQKVLELIRPQLDRSPA